MTTTDRRERALGHIASLMAIIRPGWDIGGCVAALRKLPDTMPLTAITVAGLRYAEDTSNETPAHIADLGNRAWDSFEPWPCKTHPRAGHRANGECTGCFTDRRANEQAAARFDRRPVTAEARELRTAFATRTHPEVADATSL